jgi:hypothetical protein
MRCNAMQCNPMPTAERRASPARSSMLPSLKFRLPTFLGIRLISTLFCLYQCDQFNIQPRVFMPALSSSLCALPCSCNCRRTWKGHSKVKVLCGVDSVACTFSCHAIRIPVSFRPPAQCADFGPGPGFGYRCPTAGQKGLLRSLSTR